jgi:hypothetical protein
MKNKIILGLVGAGLLSSCSFGNEAKFTFQIVGCSEEVVKSIYIHEKTGSKIFEFNNF